MWEKQQHRKILRAYSNAASQMIFVGMVAAGSFARRAAEHRVVFACLSPRDRLRDLALWAQPRGVSRKTPGGRGEARVGCPAHVQPHVGRHDWALTPLPPSSPREHKAGYMPKEDTLDRRVPCTVEESEGKECRKACLRQGRYLDDVPAGRIEQAWALCAQYGETVRAQEPLCFMSSRSAGVRRLPQTAPPASKSTIRGGPTSF